MAIAADTMKAQFASTLASGQEVSNTFALVKPGTGVPALADLVAMAADLITWFGTSYRATLLTNATLNYCKVSQVADPADPEPVFDYVDNVNLAGSRTIPGVSNPSQMCAVMSLQTPLASRRYRGHLFLPPALDDTAASGQNWNTGTPYWPACVALVAKFLAGCGAPTPTWTGSTLSSWQLAVFSGAAARAGDTPIIAGCTGVRLQPSVHWLRSRGKGAS